MDRPRVTSNKGKNCYVEGCKKEAKNKGLCTSHNYRKTVGLDLNYPPIRRGHKPGEWGDWFINKYGYVVRQRKLQGEKRVLQQRQHRVIMEQHLGRKLVEKENVHHLNGVRHDNRIENLELWSSSQPPGQRVSDKLKWAREIIDLYEGLKV